MKSRVFFFLAVPLAALFWGCQKHKANSQAAAVPPVAAPAPSGLELKDRLGEGREFPHLSAADHLGNRYDLYNLLSKPKNIVLLIDPNCPACGQEAETIQRLALRNPNLNVLGVSKDSLPAVLTFKKRHELLFPILLDVEKKLAPNYRRVTFPTLILIGADRRIIKLYEGELAPLEAQRLLRVLLGN